MTPIDLPTGRALFEQATDFSVGLEEEFAIVDRDSLDLTPGYEELSAAAAEDPVLGKSVSGELIASEIEIRSGRGEDVEDAISRQQLHRRRLFALAAAHGLELGATGTHPWADYRAQPIINTEHYHRVEEGLKWVAWRNNTFSLHVHVGIRGADRAVQVCDRLRPALPVLLAISANSPFLDGRDTGLASMRSQTFTKSFPRCGIPDPFGDWRTYSDYVDFLVRTNSIVEYTQVWWSVRPHLSFGTVEVRICDAQSTAEESDALARLIVAVVTQAAHDVDEGNTGPSRLPGRLLEENMWRAIRHGLDGKLLDLSRGEEYPAREAVERLLTWSAPARAELGLDAALPGLNGAQRQRAMLQEGATLKDVYAQVIAATRASYAQAGTSQEVTT